MRLEIKDHIGVSRAVVFVVNSSNKVYQMHKIYRGTTKVININEGDIVVEYAVRYDFKANKLTHLLYIIYYPRSMSYDEAFSRAKTAVSKYLESQISMGVNLLTVLGGYK
jgi:hypothetical protein